ncbi:hypothetical protein I4U23_030128 [Adineta vaga]|nr:hypothetical protein I4U23_030128 [Adineta vaga]
MKARCYIIDILTKRILLYLLLVNGQNLTGVDNNDDDYQLALAIALSQKEADEKQKQKRDEIKIEIRSNKNDNLLDKTAEAIERFMNRAKSNYQRNRDVIGDTALLSAFILLQTCATELEQLKDDLDHQRQHFETLQEKLTTIRDAREALNILRYEYQENKRHEQKHLEQQRRLIMMQKVADLRQFKHTQIANFQQSYFHRLLDEEQQSTERLKKQKKILNEE